MCALFCVHSSFWLCVSATTHLLGTNTHAMKYTCTRTHACSSRTQQHTHTHNTHTNKYTPPTCPGSCPLQYEVRWSTSLLGQNSPARPLPMSGHGALAAFWEQKITPLVPAHRVQTVEDAQHMQRDTVQCVCMCMGSLT